MNLSLKMKDVGQRGIKKIWSKDAFLECKRHGHSGQTFPSSSCLHRQTMEKQNVM